MFGDLLKTLLEGFGWYGMLFALYLIFVIDAAVFPAIPEVFAVLFFRASPTLTWGLLVLAIALLGEVSGNSLLYAVIKNLVVKKERMPRFLEKTMKKYIDFLILSDEKIILLNRLAPVVPFVGAFMATCSWSYPKSISYIALGSVAKYGLLLCLAGFLGILYEPETATVFSLIAVLLTVILSALFSIYYRKRKKQAQ